MTFQLHSKRGNISGLRKGENDVVEVLEKAGVGVVILAASAGLSLLKRKLLEMSGISRT
jgi:ribosomal protein L7Ae-like RNA K-turn-binding protein